MKIDPVGWSVEDYIKFYCDVWHASVVPSYKDGKIPVVKWKPYQKKRLPRTGVAKLYEKHNATGLLLVTGEVSGNLIRIDVDDEIAWNSLKKSGAIPPQTPIFKTKKGRGILLRCTEVPRGIKEYTITDPRYINVGIEAEAAITAVPPSPNKTWIQLYDEIPVIDYEAWCKEYLDYDFDTAHTGKELSMQCPYHAGHHDGSFCINLDKGVYYCHGCGSGGRIAKLIADSKEMGFDLPLEVAALDVQLTPDSLGGFRIVQMGSKQTQEEPLIQDLIANGEHATAQICGETGGGKTTLGQTIAAEACHGLPVLGRLRVAKPLKILYINFEQDAEVLDIAFEKLCASLNVPYPIPDDKLVKVVYELDDQLLLSDPKTCGNVKKLLSYTKPDLLILDSVHQAVTDINDQTQAATVVHFLKQIRKEFGLGILVLHHTTQMYLTDGKPRVSALGAIGKQIERFVANKLYLTPISVNKADKWESPEEARIRAKKKAVLQNYRRLYGKTRDFGIVDYATFYDGLDRRMWIENWEDVPGVEQKDIPLDKDAQKVQWTLGKLKRLGYTVQYISTVCGVDERTVCRWRAGEHTPEAEHREILFALAAATVAQPGLGLPDRKRPNRYKSEDHSDINGPDKNGSPGGRGVGPLNSKNNKIYYTTELEKSQGAKKKPKKTPNSKTGCDSCPLSKQSKLDITVEKKQYMCILGGPSKNDIEKGILSGGTGNKLHSLLELVGISPSDCHFTYTTLCRSTSEKPPKKAVKACADRLQQEIDKVAPEVILLLGSVGQELLLPHFPVSKFHGKCVYEHGQKWVVLDDPAKCLKSNYSELLQITDYENLDLNSTVEHIQTILENRSPCGEQVAIDLETEGLSGDILFGALAFRPGAAHPLPTLSDVIAIVRQTNQAVWHNGKFDIQHLAKEGWSDWEQCEHDDTELLAYCMNYDDLHLKSLEPQELNVWHEDYKRIIKDHAVAPKGETPTLKHVPDAIGHQYCMEDADSTLRLWQHLKREASDRELYVYEHIEKPLLPCLIKMEQRGLAVNHGYAVEWDRKLASEQAELAATMNAAGLSLDVASSPKKLGDYLKKLGLKLPTTPSGQLATDKTSLAAYLGKHPILDAVLQYRHVTKLRSTYTAPALASEDGRVHTSWNQTIVATGRLSSSGPNLQNLPHTNEARRMYCASPGNVLVAMDYGAIDLRCLAVMSGDANLLRIFQERRDPHNELADEFYGDHNAFHRYIIKKVAYSIIFLSSAKGLYKNLIAPSGFDPSEIEEPPSIDKCEELIRFWFAQFPDVERYYTEVKKDVRRHGYIESFFGRRRYIPGIHSANRGVFQAALREAVNMVTAGTAGDLFKLSIISTTPVSVPVINIHDELIFDIPKAELSETVPVLRNLMQSLMDGNPKFPCLLTVTVKIGDTWGDLEETHEYN